jgi:hypothetical protein
VTGSPRVHVDARALEHQILRLVESRLLDPIEILLDDHTPLADVRRRIALQVRRWAEQLLHDSNSQATSVVARLIGTLYPGDAPFDPPPEWWQTPLGRVTAERVGHPAARAVSYAGAGAMLGITRQGVHDLVSRGKLARHADGGVAVDSVRNRIRARAQDDNRADQGDKTTDGKAHDKASRKL